MRSTDVFLEILDLNPKHSETALDPQEAQRRVASAVDCGRLESDVAVSLGHSLEDPRVLEAVLEGADESRRQGHGDRVTVARNVFIPLTNLCRDRCAYCTFAKLPDSPEAKTYEQEEVAELVRGGVATGCTEALFCLGDKPEVAYRSHRTWLSDRGWNSTADQLEASCQLALELGLLPHTNAGILTQEQMARLRPWNASMGLMLETTSQRLRGRG